MPSNYFPSMQHPFGRQPNRSSILNSIMQNFARSVQPFTGGQGAQGGGFGFGSVQGGAGTTEGDPGGGEPWTEPTPIPSVPGAGEPRGGGWRAMWSGDDLGEYGPQRDFEWRAPNFLTNLNPWLNAYHELPGTYNWNYNPNLPGQMPGTNFPTFFDQQGYPYAIPNDPNTLYNPNYAGGGRHAFPFRHQQ